MELKTKVNAEAGKQDMVITREFDLPVELLFRAFAEPELMEQWMGTKVLKFEGRKHGSYRAQTTDAQGKVVFSANGTFHEFIPNKKIIRTFEMENTPMGVQLEFYDFEKLTDTASRLNAHIVYQSVAQRDQVLKMPFAQGLNWAHDRLQEIMNKSK
ncbi:MAG: ATPase [Bacteroidia bacterium]|jgi:uncharacterized protein YndB with AHSA1/START domain|nr:ATPase [Bacteroidia bacterium]